MRRYLEVFQLSEEVSKEATGEKAGAKGGLGITRLDCFRLLHREQRDYFHLIEAGAANTKKYSKKKPAAAFISRAL